MQYRYDDGVYYEPSNGGYRVVPAPFNAVISSLPPDYSTVNVGGDNYYYYGGVFYISMADGYQVVQAPPGAIVSNLPDGCEQIQANGITYLKYNGAYFQPIQYEGQDVYEVVDME
jgi:hypothetical protein